MRKRRHPGWDRKACKAKTGVCQVGKGELFHEKLLVPKKPRTNSNDSKSRKYIGSPAGGPVGKKRSIDV